MTLQEAMKQRHSVRSYKETSLSDEQKRELQDFIAQCNSESGLHIQLVTDEPKAFDGIMAHYGKFSGVHNYVALIGKKGANLEEKVGYYGEKVILKAQQMGLNTCWVAMTFGKGKAKKNVLIDSGEKLVCVLSLGYGAKEGIAHKSKDMSELCSCNCEMPDWFKNGMEAAMLAPTAMNQQKFLISLDGNTVMTKNLGGFYSGIDLGIVKYHFEIGAGKNNFIWG